MRDKRAVVWSKTDHSFPTEGVLGEFRRQLGQVLLESNKIDETDLQAALAAKQAGERLGDTLVRLGLVSERDVTSAVADQAGLQSGVEDDLIPTPEALATVPFEVAQDNGWLPLRVREKMLDIAVNGVPTRQEIDALEHLSQLRVVPHVVERRRLEAAISRAYRFGNQERAKPIGVYLVDAGYIDRTTLDGYLETPDPAGRRLLERVTDDGHLDDGALLTIVSKYFDVPVHDEDLHVAPVDPDTFERSVDLLSAHRGLVLGRIDGVLTVLSAIPLDSSIVDSINARFGAVRSVVATRSHLSGLRDTIDNELQRLAESR
jgi:hypothetical protein